MWDKHWSKGAAERTAEMALHERSPHRRAPPGVQIIHAPSDTLDFYKDTLARQRIRLSRCAAAGGFEPPRATLPIDSSDEGSDTGETEPPSGRDNTPPSTSTKKRM